MSDVKTDPGLFSAHTITEFCMAVVAGEIKGPSPVQGVRISEADRTLMGFHDPGQTFGFEIVNTAVFLDLTGNHSQVWFVHPTASKRAVGLMEKALLAKWPDMTKTTDQVHPADAALQRRVYEGRVKGDQIAKIEIVFPPEGSNGSLFMTRVFAFTAVGGETPALPDTAATLPSRAPQSGAKKKGPF